MLKLPRFTKATKTPAMPKMRLRRRHVKKVLMIVAYTFVALIMVAGAVAPALRF